MMHEPALEPGEFGATLSTWYPSEPPPGTSGVDGACPILDDEQAQERVSIFINFYTII